MLKGELAALATAACWALTGLFFAEAARRIGSLRVNLLRLPIALALLSAALATGERPFNGLDAVRVGYLAASGVVGLVVGDLAYFGALRRIGTRQASLLMSLAPAFATLAALPLLGEWPAPRALAGVVVTLAGVAWVVGEPRGSDTAVIEPARAVALGVLGAACQGTGLVLAKLGMAGSVPPLTATWLRIAVATSLIWALVALAGRARGLGATDALRRAVWPVAGGAVFGPFVGVWCSLIAARHAEVGVAATIMATTPILVIPLVAVTERYRPTPRALAGTLLAVLGVALLFSS